jgi:hypothetical protein
MGSARRRIWRKGHLVLRWLPPRLLDTLKAAPHLPRDSLWDALGIEIDVLVDALELVQRSLEIFNRGIIIVSLIIFILILTLAIELSLIVGHRAWHSSARQDNLNDLL